MAKPSQVTPVRTMSPPTEESSEEPGSHIALSELRQLPAPAARHHGHQTCERAVARPTAKVL